MQGSWVGEVRGSWVSTLFVEALVLWKRELAGRRYTSKSVLSVVVGTLALWKRAGRSYKKTAVDEKRGEERFVSR
ncbi:hypothetical protein R1flu_014556 [Riccia fluitans]|uniref:Uncharacterized protein n=1 Tax=Riccia fluitans TaxID=41844 RepID=A0ABD1YGS4_9MARC